MLFTQALENQLSDRANIAIDCAVHVFFVNLGIIGRIKIQ
jgi:hypothetical protein